MKPIPSIIGLLPFVFTSSILVSTAESSESPLDWLNNSAIQSLIGAIFDQIDHIDIVIGQHDTTGDKIGHLVHHEEAVLRWKSIRIYGGEILRISDGESRCTGGHRILSAKLTDVFDSLDMINRDYSEEFSLFQWDLSYDTFAKVWDQNHHNGYMVFTNMSTFETMLKCLLDPKATYLIILDAAENFTLADMSNKMHTLWIQENLYRLFYLLGGRMYTYDPFKPNGAKYGLMVELEAGKDIPRIPNRDFNGYPLKIDVFRSTYSVPVLNATGAMTHFVGADVEVSRVFSKSLNFTAKYLPPDKNNFGTKLPNGTFNGVIGRLSRHQSDIAFVGFFIKDYFSRDVEFTAGVYTDELCCLVKKASRVPEYLLPITIFPADLWTLLFLMGIVCSIAWIVLRAGIQAKGSTQVRWAQKRRFAHLFNLSDEIRDAPLYRKMVQICIDTYLLLLSAPYQRFTRSGIERLMLFGIMMVSLIFVSMFQSSLSSVFLNPVYYKDIDSLQRLDESGVKIPVKYKGYLDDVFPANNSPMMDSLRSKMTLEEITESMLARVARLGTISTVTRKTTLSLDNAVYIKTKQLFMIPECPRSYNLGYVVPRHSVLLERFNLALLWMLNGGLIDHWIDVMNFNVSIKDWDQIRNSDEANFKILTMIDMQFPFYLLVIGLIFSTGMFICEHLYYRILLKCNLKRFAGLYPIE